MKAWKLSIFNIVDKRIKFYSQNTNLLPPKPKSSFRHLKQGIQEFHRKYVLVPTDMAENNVVVVCHCCLFDGYTTLTFINRNLMVQRLTMRHP